MFAGKSMGGHWEQRQLAFGIGWYSLLSFFFLSEPAKPFSRKWPRADSGLQFPCLCPDGCSGTGAMSPCSVLCWAFWSLSLIVYSSFQGSAVPMAEGGSSGVVCLLGFEASPFAKRELIDPVPANLHRPTPKPATFPGTSAWVLIISFWSSGDPIASFCAQVALNAEIKFSVFVLWLSQGCGPHLSPHPLFSLSFLGGSNHQIS